MRVLPALAVAALHVVAGCAGPAVTTDATTAPDASGDATTAASTDEATGDDGTSDDGTNDDATTAATTTQESTESSTAQTTATTTDTGGENEIPPASELDVDDDETFAQLTAMLGVDAEQPTFATRNLSRYFQNEETTRQRLLGIEEYVENPENDPHGLATPNGIYVQPAGAPPEVVEQVVVHEQFHAIQFEKGWTSTRAPHTTDGRLAMGGAVEGASVWVVGEYTERYQGEDVPRQIRMVEEAVVEGSDGWRLFRAPYYFGARWTEHHLDDPANVSWVYETPPETTEQLMHNLSAGEEPVEPIAVDVVGEGWFDSAGDRMGEAYVWATLRGELDANRSWNGAAGWGGDELRMVSGADGDTRNVTWAIRWDSVEDADEFAAAYEVWVSERDVDARFRLVRVDEDVTVLLAGDEAFVEQATVSMDGETVVVDRTAQSDENESLVTTPRLVT